MLLLSITSILSLTFFCATTGANCPRQPPKVPDVPQTFNRSVTFLPGLHDNCCDWEARALEADKPLGTAKTICRSKCPEGYGSSQESCVWRQNFVPHKRVLGIRDQCYSSEDRSIVDGGIRITCTASCPEGMFFNHLNGECNVVKMVTRDSTMIMTNVSVYPIYYGQWSPDRINKIQTFIRDLDQSAWFQTNKDNYGIQKLTLKAQTHMPQNATVWKTKPVDANSFLESIHIHSNQWSRPDGIYMVFLPRLSYVGKDETAFWSGYFNSSMINMLTGTHSKIKYVLIHDSPSTSDTRRITSAEPQDVDIGLQRIYNSIYSSIIIHATGSLEGLHLTNADEMIPKESTFDIDIGWYCRLSLGTVCESSNGMLYNTIIGDKQCLIQTTYNPTSGKCENNGQIDPAPGQKCYKIQTAFNSHSVPRYVRVGEYLVTTIKENINRAFGRGN